MNDNEYKIEPDGSILIGAERFASQWLKKVSANPLTWEVHYIHTATGEEWIMDHPNGHLQGGGPGRLRKKTPK